MSDPMALSVRISTNWQFRGVGIHVTAALGCVESGSTNTRPPRSRTGPSSTATLRSRTSPVAVRRVLYRRRRIGAVGTGQNSRTSGLADTVGAVINGYLPRALRDEGVPADVLELVDAACRLAEVREDCLQWTLRCRSVRVDPGAEPVVEAMSDVNANLLDEIWDFGHNIIPHLDEAIREHAAGGPELSR